jgi:protein-arginine kinase activator protein McsA
MLMENFINQLFIDSINIMKTDEWEWPSAWTVDRRIKFLDESLSYAEKREFYEQCAIIRDVKKSITEENQTKN